MKSYSFYFNASDWLSSPAVKLMSKAERGAYIDLLAIAWQSSSPGTLPASEDKVRRLAELSTAEWAESREALLEQFPLSECETYRFNKRLMLEVDKEETKSRKASASAKMRWQSEGNANASKKHANASKNACERNAQEQVQEQDTTDVVAPATAAALPASENRKAAARRTASEAGAETYLAEASPLYKPEPLKAYYTELVKLLPGLDWDWYVTEMRLKAPTDELTAPQWRNWIINFVKNEGTTYRRIVAPLPNQVASNVGQPFVASGIPDSSAYLKPVTTQPAGQYTGTVR